MSTLTAKLFRQQILRPAEGIFLFHARAIERLIEKDIASSAKKQTIPTLPYYLMVRRAFLTGLESENVEALSIIEGLNLPRYVILLPAPPVTEINPEQLESLRTQYWAHRFEAEIARAWQMNRDTEADAEDFGAHTLQLLLTEHAYLEVQAVLERDGLVLPNWDAEQRCRTFVAMMIRLRYFAPGARAFFFPAIRDWPLIDAWITSSGLDLPAPLISRQRPPLLLKSRPGGIEPTVRLPILPVALPYGHCDPDLRHALCRLDTQHQRDQRHHEAQDLETVSSLIVTDRDDWYQELQQHCYAILNDTSAHHHPTNQWHHWFYQSRARISCLIGQPLFSVFMHRWWKFERHHHLKKRWLQFSLILLQQTLIAAHYAQKKQHFATALIYFAKIRLLLLRLFPNHKGLNKELKAVIEQREEPLVACLVTSLGNQFELNTTHLSLLTAFIHHLVAKELDLVTASATRTILIYLETVITTTAYDYYRWHPWRWLLSFGSHPIREKLPFHSSLRSLRILQTLQIRIDELSWPVTDLNQYSALIDVLIRHIHRKLQNHLLPQLEHALRDAGFQPRNHRENVAAHKLNHELFDVIQQRRHLKFTDIRDSVARNILRLPDPSLQEFFHGDRLRRFDRTASQALPGVYRSGEFYIKGLQLLAAPLFGTNTGRILLRHLLLPIGLAYLGLKSIDLIIHLLPWQPGADFIFANAPHVVAIALATNLFLYTDIGRHIVAQTGYGLRLLWKFYTQILINQIRHHPSYHWLLYNPLVRHLGQNIIQPLLIGTLPLIPIIILATFIDEVPMQPGVWLVGLAFALGTLASRTSEGRRFTDNIASRLYASFDWVNQALIIGAIRHLMYLFKELIHRITQVLYHVDDHLTLRLHEPTWLVLMKAPIIPVWNFAESVIQFYITVLVEPQINPVKHFPVVTIGHKLMLPFLPGITTFLVALTESVLPKVLAYPLATITIVLLPGLFGFLAWELKENWKLYQANHSVALRRLEGGEACFIEPAIIGHHGETMRAILCRGFHSGTLPKGFDRLRQTITQELYQQTSNPRRIRAIQRQLQDIQQSICIFVDRELSFALRERCKLDYCPLQYIKTQEPRLSVQGIEIEIALYYQKPITLEKNTQQPIKLQIGLSLQANQIMFATRVLGNRNLLNQHCWEMIEEDLHLFAGRAGAHWQKTSTEDFNKTGGQRPLS
jgi:hypothetical protein